MIIRSMRVQRIQGLILTKSSNEEMSGENIDQLESALNHVWSLTYPGPRAMDFSIAVDIFIAGLLALWP